MTVLRFPAPEPPISLNESRGMHWSQVRERTKPWRDVTWARARSAGLRSAGPIVVTVRLPMTGRRRRDPHNYAPVLKAVVDGLVLARVVPDDTPEWVSTREPVLVDVRDEPLASVIVEARPADWADR